MLGRFYIGCDRCDGWYHGSCVGVTKSEADVMDTYVCPLCQQKESLAGGDDGDPLSMPLQERHWLELRRIVNSLQVHNSSTTSFVMHDIVNYVCIFVIGKKPSCRSGTM